MAEAGARNHMLEKYLEELASGLRGIPPEEAREIVDEIRSHIRDFAGEPGGLNPNAVEDALHRFGTARDLASRYVMQNMAARAHSSGSLFLALKTIYRWAKLSLAGFAALVVTALGYATAGTFAYAALAKPFAPHRVGLWRLPDANDLSISLGRVDQPGARELLGWWIIPLGICLAVVFFFLTQRFVMWAIRRLRRTSSAISPIQEQL